jgi:hypothetical protein
MPLTYGDRNNTIIDVEWENVGPLMFGGNMRRRMETSAPGIESYLSDGIGHQKTGIDPVRARFREMSCTFKEQ